MKEGRGDGRKGSHRYGLTSTNVYKLVETPFNTMMLIKQSPNSLSVSKCLHLPHQQWVLALNEPPSVSEDESCVTQKILVLYYGMLAAT